MAAQYHHSFGWLVIAALAGTSAPTAAHEVYVSNEKDNTVSVIDTLTLGVVRTFPVGKRPRGITFSRDGAQFFVCASDSNAVQVYAADGDRHLYDLPSGEDPEQFALTPDGATLYIANEDNAVTTIVDLATRQVVKQVSVGVEPEGVAVSPDGKFAVTTSETTNMAHIINAKTHEVVANVLVPPRPRFAKFTADSSKLWVTSEIGGTLSIIDMATLAVEKTISFQVDGVGKDHVQPVGLVFTSNQATAFVALGPSNRIAAIDVATATVTKYILVGQRVWHLALTPEDDMLFSTNGVSNDVTIVDARSLRALKSIKVGRYPWGVAVRPARTPNTAAVITESPRVAN
jgi:PQQ-dependent catabolism-associated beta-propeller protein